MLFLIPVFKPIKYVKVRDKEEELENSLQKIDNLRQDIRKAEKLRRELEVMRIFNIMTREGF
jgi:hypothetical protein